MKSFFPFLFSMLGVFAFQTVWAQTHGSTGECPNGNEEKGPVNSDYEQRVVELLNDERVDNGLPPLKKNDDLFDAARFHAWDMCKVGYFSHASRDTNDNKTCKANERMAKFYKGNSYRENIGAGYENPKDANNKWINSPPHYQTMLAENVREIGVGYFNNCKKLDSSQNIDSRWVENFGRRAGVYPVVINNEYYATNERAVNLYIYGKDEFNEIRLKNKSDQQWSEWTSFKANYDNWELPRGKGFKTVQVQMRNSNDTIKSSDKIYLEKDSTTAFQPKEASKKPTVKIYPNPVLDNTTSIKLNPHKNGPYQVKILNQLGQEVKQVFSGQLSRNAEKTIRVNASGLATGSYFVKIRNTKTDHTKIQKLVMP